MLASCAVLTPGSVVLETTLMTAEVRTPGWLGVQTGEALRELVPLPHCWHCQVEMLGK